MAQHTHSLEGKQRQNNKVSNKHVHVLTLYCTVHIAQIF